MKSADLVRMVNQIADFFSAYPDDEAIPMVEGHIRQFWERRMRSDLAALLNSDAADDLRPLARAGAEAAVADLTPAR